MLDESSSLTVLGESSLTAVPDVVAVLALLAVDALVDVAWAARPASAPVPATAAAIVPRVTLRIRRRPG